MDITLPRAALHSILDRAQRVVERRNTIPILSNVLLEASLGRLKATTTDLDMTVTTECDATVVEAGGITAPAHQLADIARRLADGPVRLTTTAKDGRLSVTAGRSRFELMTIPPSDFPTMAFEMKGAASAIIGGPALATALDHVSFAMSSEEVRYYLNGVFWHRPPEAKGFRLVATDGHRLARVDLVEAAGGEGWPGIIVPRKAITEVRRLFAAGEVTVEATDTKIRFSAPDLSLTSKLIDGTFPEYERVIPRDAGRTILVECAPLAAALDRVLTVSSDRARAIRFCAAGDEVTLTCTNADAGSAVETVPLAETFDGSFEAGFNGRYLLEQIGLIDGPMVRLAVIDAGSPARFDAPDDPSCLYVLMPMRVS